MTEAQLRKACVDLLELDGWRNLRTDPVSDRSTVQAIRRAIARLPLKPAIMRLVLDAIDHCVRGKGFGELGMADDLFIRYLRFYAFSETMWIEWKGPRGTAAPHQLAWHEAERKRGAFTVIAGKDFEATVEGFWSWYLKAGLLVKPISLQGKKGNEPS